MLTKIKEDYLKAIYLISAENNTKPVRIVDIANYMNIKRSSVFKMISALAEMNYVEKDEYAMIRLTETGAQTALKLIRMHKLIKNFLEIHLCFSSEESELEAAKLEHSLSPLILERMELCAKNRTIECMRYDERLKDNMKNQ